MKTFKNFLKEASMSNNSHELADQEIIKEAKEASIGIELENISGKIDWRFDSDKLSIGIIGQGMSYYTYDNKALKAKTAGGADWTQWVNTSWESTKKKLLALADKFDRDVLKIMNQSGFKKRSTY